MRTNNPTPRNKAPLEPPNSKPPSRSNPPEKQERGRSMENEPHPVECDVNQEKEEDENDALKDEGRVGPGFDPEGNLRVVSYRHDKANRKAPARQIPPGTAPLTYPPCGKHAQDCCQHCVDDIHNGLLEVVDLRDTEQSPL